MNPRPLHYTEPVNVLDPTMDSLSSKQVELDDLAVAEVVASDSGTRHISPRSPFVEHMHEQSLRPAFEPRNGETPKHDMNKRKKNKNKSVNNNNHNYNNNFKNKTNKNILDVQTKNTKY